MHHTRSRTLIVAVLFILGYTAVSTTFNNLPVVVSIDNGLAASEGGSTGGSTGGTGGGSNNGGHRGHTTNVTRVVIKFLAQVHQIGTQENQVPRWHPYSAPFVDNEKQFLCSLQRYFSRLEASAVNSLVLAELERLMNRDESMIARFLRNPQSCK